MLLVCQVSASDPQVTAVAHFSEVRLSLLLMFFSCVCSMVVIGFMDYTMDSLWNTFLVCSELFDKCTFKLVVFCSVLCSFLCPLLDRMDNYPVFRINWMKGASLTTGLYILDFNSQSADLVTHYCTDHLISH